MPLIDTNHQRAAMLVLLLGIALVIALTPYATGLLGIPVLYAVFAPLHVWLGMRVRPRIAASLVVALALFLIVVPGVSFAGLIVRQAQEIAAASYGIRCSVACASCGSAASISGPASPTWARPSSPGSARPRSD